MGGPEVSKLKSPSVIVSNNRMNPAGGHMVYYDIADFLDSSKQYCFLIELALRGRRTDLLQEDVGMPCRWRANPAWYVLRLYRGHVIHRHHITALEAYAVCASLQLTTLRVCDCLLRIHITVLESPQQEPAA